MTERKTESPKEEALLDLPKPAQKNRRWTLLLVGDSGRIIRVKRVRGWITLLAALPVLTLALAAGAYLRSDSWPGRNRGPTDEINRLRAEVRALTEENARLASRRLTPEKESLPLVKPAQKMPEAAKAPPMPDDADDPAGEDAAGPIQSPLEAADSEARGDFGRKADAVEGDGEASGSGADPSAPVEVRGLTLDFGPGRSTLSVDFKIFNRRPDGEPLFGYAFVILKPDEQRAEQWLVFPEAAIDSQGPVSFKGGYDFSIANFMIIRFKPRQLPPAMVFQKATIQVYDASGRLLLAKDFHLDSDN